MGVGLSAYDMGARELVDLSEAADEMGFDTLWLGEHILHSVGYRSEHPTHGSAAHRHHTGPIVDPHTELIDPLVALGAAAARTTRLRLATGIYLLPLRHPILTARAAATLHELSCGRFLLGVGAGWLREEFDALGVPFAGRGARVEEAVTVLRAAWSGEPFSHVGSNFAIEPMQLTTRPTPVPIVLGGNSKIALERAAALADAWFSSGTPALDEAVALVAALRDLHRSFGRAGDLRCYVRIARDDPELVAAYHDAGLDDIVIWADQVWRGDDLEAKRESLRKCAARLGVAP
jgi:probable F420-dependent oxidoreductase